MWCARASLFSEKILLHAPLFCMHALLLPFEDDDDASLFFSLYVDNSSYKAHPHVQLQTFLHYILLYTIMIIITHVNSTYESAFCMIVCSRLLLLSWRSWFRLAPYSIHFFILFLLQVKKKYFSACLGFNTKYIHRPINFLYFLHFIHSCVRKWYIFFRSSTIWAVHTPEFEQKLQWFDL